MNPRLQRVAQNASRWLDEVSGPADRYPSQRGEQYRASRPYAAPPARRRPAGLLRTLLAVALILVVLFVALVVVIVVLLLVNAPAVLSWLGGLAAGITSILAPFQQLFAPFQQLQGGAGGG